MKNYMINFATKTWFSRFPARAQRLRNKGSRCSKMKVNEFQPPTVQQGPRS